MVEAGVAFSSVPQPELPPGAAPGHVPVDCGPAVRAAGPNRRANDHAFTGPLPGEFLHLHPGDVRPAPGRDVRPAQRLHGRPQRLQKPPSARPGAPRRRAGSPARVRRTNPAA